MGKNKSAGQVGRPPLETGQLWRMQGANLRVGLVGKMMVHYKLGKPDALRTPNSCSLIKVIEQFLKTKKAVLD